MKYLPTHMPGSCCISTATVHALIFASHRQAVCPGDLGIAKRVMHKCMLATKRRICCPFRSGSSGDGVAVHMQQSFGVGAAAVGTTLSTYALARLMMNIPSGIIGDTRGRKPLMVWGPAITALGERPSMSQSEANSGVRCIFTG